jgi:hypothetical protein
MEEFILRIGANANALKSELGRAGTFAKAWATTLVEDMRTRLGRMFLAGFALDKAMEFGRRVMEQVRERVLAVKRAQGELPGVSTNFIQGVFNYLERIGVSFETISKPLLKFKQLLDSAKVDPTGAEMRTLERYNIVASEADLKTQKYATSVSKLSEAYLKSGKNLKVLEDLLGKESISPAMLALLELGPEKLSKLDQTNIFTALTPSNLNFFSNNFQGATSIGQVITATFGNMIGNALNHDIFTMFVRGISKWRHPIDALKNPRQTIEDIWNGKTSEARVAEEKVQQSIEQDLKRVEIKTKFLELTEKERELNAVIADQGKVSLDRMASEARRITGIKAPIHTLTPRMMESLRIQNLEEGAQIAYEQGNDTLSHDLINQAQKLRSADTWLRDKDRDPMAETNASLDIIKQQLVPISAFVANLNKDSKKGE